jgi:GrpB-like predicted nucleotidyltransferase (UPF0157 family)
VEDTSHFRHKARDSPWFLIVTLSAHVGELIVIVDYDPAWPDAFERERERIAAALGERALAIEHYGSTAVRGIAAKPIIDVMVVRDLDAAEDEVASLERAGYERRPAGDLERPRRLFFVRYDGDRRAAHLALIGAGGDYWDEHVAFRTPFVRTRTSLTGMPS